ncbi:ANTAR domain-containing protein [Actinomycetospora cinnamomea]|uniref:ANTAR domain-containing protein n=1 Tax=Actinomycetospora cinnamomea TaxID=663609 RepID=A0A2U1FFU4_9PSEU|nr:ANTAR domain-containing protein [Actinomycetospora cinnamomea]PVZ10840.1 ANTAR domain-containing protein [Actinomycetospora cinnamomea]
MPEDDHPKIDDDVISCATDILMRRYGCDVEEAGSKLRDWSRETNLGVLTVAAWLIEDAAGGGSGGGI